MTELPAPGESMTVRDMLTALQLPWDAEPLAFESGSECYCQHEVEW